ncbi:MAG: Uma2 family endonuclease [Bacteroidia bacterium]
MKNKYTQSEESQVVSEPDYGGSYTVKDYLSWTFDGLYEIIKGKVWKMSPAPTSDHQRIDRRIVRKMLPYFPEGGNCELFYAPYDVYLIKEGDDLERATTVLQPDVCIVCNPKKIEKRGCIGAPDLVVEIISPSTAKKDLNDKFKVYEEFGVKEYWVVFPGEKAINIYTLVNGKYELFKSFGQDEELQSPLFEQLNFVVSEVF